MGVGLELHSFGAHLLQAAIDEVLLHLEVGDAVAQQPADAVVLLEDRDAVAGARQLLRGGEAGGSRSYDSHPFACAGFGRVPLGIDWKRTSLKFRSLVI